MEKNKEKEKQGGEEEAGRRRRRRRRRRRSREEKEGGQTLARAAGSSFIGLQPVAPAAATSPPPVNIWQTVGRHTRPRSSCFVSRECRVSECPSYAGHRVIQELDHSQDCWSAKNGRK